MTRLDAARRDISAMARLSAVSLWRGVIGVYNGHHLTYAASIAYYALLSLFPFSLLAVSILGAATADETDRNIVLGFVLQYLPSQFEFITVQLDAFRAHSTTFNVLGTFALVWGALGVFSEVTSAVNYAWRVEKSRSYWKHKLFSFAMLAVAGGLLLATLVLVSATEIVETSWFAGVLRHFPGLLVLRSVALHNAATMLFILVVGLIFYFVPNTKVRFRDVWVGAFLTGILWRGALLGFSWWVRDMTRFTRINGSIAAVVVFLLWIYLQAVILLYGVEFTAAFARLRRVSVPDARGVTKAL